MDIRKVSDEEKKRVIERTKIDFNQIRSMLDTLEHDIESEDLMIQASAVWISHNLNQWFNDFMHEIRNIHKQKTELQQEIMDVNSLSMETESTQT